MVGMTFKNHRRSSTMVIVIRSNNVYILHPLKDIRRSLGGLRPNRPSPLLAVLCNIPPTTSYYSMCYNVAL